MIKVKKNRFNFFFGGKKINKKEKANDDGKLR